MNRYLFVFHDDNSLALQLKLTEDQFDSLRYLVWPTDPDAVGCYPVPRVFIESFDE